MYGTVSNVAVLASTWTRNGEFFDTDAYLDGTTPSLAQVNIWLEQMSRTIDFAISNEGFVTPITNPTAVAAISGIVEGVVADLCHAAHKSGRFFTKKALESGKSPLLTIQKELNEWVAGKVVAFTSLGIPTTTNAVGSGTASFDVL